MVNYLLIDVNNNWSNGVVCGVERGLGNNIKQVKSNQVIQSIPDHLLVTNTGDPFEDKIPYARLRLIFNS